LKAGVLAFVHWQKELGEDEPLFRFFVMRNPSSSQRWKPALWYSGGNINGEIPLYILLLAAGIPTFVLFYRDRRHPPGHCQKCGYNLTGNESGVCPECGTKPEVP